MKFTSLGGIQGLTNMKFDALIHPELVFDKRGNLELRRIYREFLGAVSYSSKGWTYTRTEDKEVNKTEDFLPDKVTNPTPGKVLGSAHTPARFIIKPILQKLDENSRDHFCMVKKFKSDGGKLYHVNHDFLDVLSKINREIPLDCLPERFLGYISFAPNTIKDDTGYIQGAYVFIGDAEETCLNPEQWGKKFFWCSYIEQGDNLTVTALRIVLENKTMQELISDIQCFDYGWKKDDKGNVFSNRIERSLNGREVVFRTLINSVIYIHCQNPIIDKTNSCLSLSQTKKKKVRQEKGIVNETALPITFINWRYERPIMYSKDKTMVVGHFRRQHYGPKNTAVKAIYIEEHERILNKEALPSQYEANHLPI